MQLTGFGSMYARDVAVRLVVGLSSRTRLAGVVQWQNVSFPS